MVRSLLVILIAYLLGSIPFGYLLVRGGKGTDVRAAVLQSAPFTAPHLPRAAQAQAVVRVTLGCRSPGVRFADLGLKRLRFFLRGHGPRAGSYRIVPEIRDLIKFRHLDLRNPIWPLPSDFHMIFCRNVSIYFAEDERMELLDRLSQHLRPGGWLAIGNGEILPGVPSSLRKHSPSIYRKET